MRIPLAITSIPIIALHGTVDAGPLRACEQVSARVDGAVRPLLTNQVKPDPYATRLVAELRACLSSRNICSIVYNTRTGKDALVAGDVSADLPPQYLPAQGKSPVMLVVRSIPRVRNDSNQYCLVSEHLSAATSVQQWDVYGWVIAPDAAVLPLQKQVLSDAESLRGVAAALWFFAERMSGQPASSW
jgi:hypothetical protein